MVGEVLVTAEVEAEIQMNPGFPSNPSFKNRLTHEWRVSAALASACYRSTRANSSRLSARTIYASMLLMSVDFAA